MLASYFGSLSFSSLLVRCPGGIAQGLVWGIMALGVFLTFRILDFADLSVDGSFATGGAVSIMLIMGGMKPELTLIVCFAAGCVAGIVTGILNTKLGIPAILAGILTQISLYSVNLGIMGKANQAVNVNRVKLLFTSNALHLWRTIGITAAVCAVIIAILYWYLGTEHGSALRATGNNREMASAQGINTKAMTVIALALSNGLVAVSGGILSQYQGFADINMGRGAIVVGLAAVIIGEVLRQALFGKHSSFSIQLSFVVIGAIIYYLVTIFVLWLGFPANYMKLLTAIVVAIFLAVPYLRDQKKNSFARLKKQGDEKNA